MVSIVRCKVLYQMILNQAKSRSILQVWFSSGWSESTLREFIEACNLLLESKKLPRNEANLVQHWLKKNVTLQIATNEKFKGTLIYLF
jgi:predicted nucleic acid-binding protein